MGRLVWAAGVLLLVSAGLVAQAPAGGGRQGAPAGGRQGGRGGPQEQVQIQPGEECPPGMTEFRAGRCGKPATPPPSIVDYRPKSTVVAEEHLVPRAKFPVVDIHSHLRITPDNIEQTIGQMDALNLRVLVNLTAGSGDTLKQAVDTIRSSKYADRFRVFANVNWDGVGSPGWKEREVAALEQAIKDGAIGLKVLKNLGLYARKADGSRLKVDDPELDPIWQTAARHNVPVLIHVADPAQFFAPVDLHNERWLELAIFPGREYPRDRFPSFEELMNERDRMFARNPKTRFINAHFGWHANDFARAARHLDALQNVVLEVGAVLYEFGRQPRAAREFFIKYQDRILFGKDAYAPSEYPYYWRVFETTDEYFDYYRDYHAFWKLYGMDLPDAVLRKLYYGNALKVAPGLPQTGW
ncbi:MAG: amidohydrolase family protein [Vicinamibacterales bacterium]